MSESKILPNNPNGEGEQVKYRMKQGRTDKESAELTAKVIASLRRDILESGIEDPLIGGKPQNRNVI